MKPKDIFTHLRLPFSLFLMPVFWFAFSQAPEPNHLKAILIFCILHFVLYPASNAYNSYFDKDEGSIGGVKNPPKVDKSLYYVAILLDFLAVILGVFLINPIFGIGVFMYGLFSRAYSHDAIRIKKYPVLSWLIVGVLQGFWVYCLVIQGLSLTFEINSRLIFGGILSSIMLWALYPMTQIYQHEEDAKRGDLTLSRILGLRGTFVFTATVFLMAMVGFFLFLNLSNFLIFIGCTAPITIFFLWWFIESIKNESEINFQNTMILNVLASFCMNVFYIYLLVNR